MKHSNSPSETRNCKNPNKNSRSFSSEIRGDLDADEEHAHDVSENNGGHSGGGVRGLHSPGAVAVEREVEEHDPDPAEHEHEPGRQALDDVLAVYASRHENDGSYGTGVRVLRGPDPWGLDDDVVDDARDDHEVGEEDEGEDEVGGGEGEGGELQTEAWGAEEAEGEEAEDVVDRI